MGSGGREHALAWKMAQSAFVEKVYVAPGNGGTAINSSADDFDPNKITNVAISEKNFSELINFAEQNKIDLTVIGPDDPLADGIVDEFEKNNLKVFGPKKTAAQIEASKVFAKKIMLEQGIPTANFEIFTNYNDAQKFIKKHSQVGSQGYFVPLVIKADGLARGKGVFICRSMGEAEEALAGIFLNKIFGQAGEKVVIEEYLEGQEVSMHALCDGNNFILFPPSQDHKQAYEGGKGPNTGGMGVIAPVNNLYENNREELVIIKKVLKSMQQKGQSFKGLLYPGLKIVQDPFNKGNLTPYVLEFNARFGDPETQTYMRLLDSDLYELLQACADGNLNRNIIESIKWYDGYAAGVVLASEGYPGEYQTGFEITGIEKAEAISEVKVFHAGTKLQSVNAGNKLITSGGRVLTVTARAETLEKALAKAYQAVDLIDFQGGKKYYRRDIGAEGLSKKQQTTDRNRPHQL